MTKTTAELNADTPALDASDGVEQNLSMLMPDRLFSLSAGTQDGYYYVQPGATDHLTEQIRYVDYANAVGDIVLSENKTSCLARTAIGYENAEMPMKDGRLRMCESGHNKSPAQD